MTIDASTFAQLGIAGAMLYWFMFRVEKKLDSHATIIENLSRAILLDVLSRENLSERVRKEADTLLQAVGRVPLSDLQEKK